MRERLLKLVPRKFLPLLIRHLIQTVIRTMMIRSRPSPRPSEEVQLALDYYYAANPAENDVKQLEGLTRTLVAQVEEKLGITITAESRALSWAGRHAAFLRTRLVIGADGKPM